MNSIYYNKLPDTYWKYIQPDCIKTIEKLRSLWRNEDHSLFKIPKKMVLTELGLSKFEHYTHIDVFRANPNHIGAIHVDNSYHAFNFIIKGSGRMQWFDIADIEYTTKTRWNTAMFKLKSNKTFVEETDCNLLWINTKKPHRLVVGEEERICLSIRYK
jgi:hypothetical protein